MNIEELIKQIIDDTYNKYKDYNDNKNLAEIIRNIQHEYYNALEPYSKQIDSLPNTKITELIQYAASYSNLCKNKWIGREIWHGFDSFYEFMPLDK